MISKIIKMQGVGTLHDPLQNHRAVELGKTSVVYAENGRGKSTLSAILSSLSSGSPEKILSRQTLNGNLLANVQLLIENQSYTYKNGEWSGRLDDILVFDADFVDKNVHSGGKIDPQQRESLLEFVLGEEGVQLKSDIDVITDRISELNKSIRSVKQVVETYSKPMNLDKFVNLTRDSGLEEKILLVSHQLTEAKNAEAIKSRPSLKNLDLPVIDFEKIECLLQQSLESIDTWAEKKVLEYIKLNLNENGESWIKQGMDYMSDDICPFCSQDVKGMELIRAYKTYFSSEYNNHIEQVSQLRESLKLVLSDENLDNLLMMLLHNESTLLQWTIEHDSLFGTLNRDMIVKTWRAMQNTLTTLFNRKTNNVLASIGFDEVTRAAFEQYKALGQFIMEFNCQVEAWNAKFQQQREAVSNLTLSDVQSTYNLLLVEQKRWDSEVDNKCNEYKSLLIEKEGLESKKEEKRSHLTLYSDQLMDVYEEKINVRLVQLHSSFKIVKVNVTHTSGTPRCEYHIQLFNHLIPLTARGQGPSFESALSEGDKRTLALAFFLARFDTSNDKQRKIVVVDDPVTSLDRHRRRATIDALIEIAGKSSQLLLLSHDAEFLKMFCQRQESTMIEIRRDGVYSVFDSCDIYEICESEYYKNYRILREFVDHSVGSSDLKNVARRIRPYLEHVLRVTFPLELRNAKNLGDILRHIRESRQNSAIRKLAPCLAELDSLNNYTSSFHHDNADIDTEIISESELYDMVNRAFEIGYGTRNVAIVQ